MNETGVRILEAAREGRSLDEIVAAMQAHYPEVPEATLREDAGQVLADLVRHALLVPTA